MEGKYTLALDARSVRTVDENGFLHVGNSHITKAKVDPYHGNEVPGWQEKGLDPGKIYYGLRDPDELQKALTTWAGLPLHFRHHEDSADEPAKMTRVGNVGTDITWNAPYVDAPLTIWDQTAIDAINNGTCRELSCAYRYDPDWTPGTYEGRPYDFIMRNIRGNHVALVEEGRAGADVLVADHQTVKDNSQGGKPMADKKTMAKDGDPAIEQKEVDLAQAIIDLHRVDPTTGQIVDVQEDEGKVGALREVMGELASKLAPEELGKLKAVLAGLVAPVDDAELEPAANPYKEAMDACGLDSNDEAAQKAFAEGVKFAQSQQPEGDAVLEPAPAPAPAKDTNKACDKTCANDAKPEDMTMQQPKKPVVTMDANAIKAQAVQETRQHMQDLFTAVEAVKPLTGALKPMTFDSADDVYKHALQVKGIDPTKYDRTAWRGMVDMLLMQQPSGFRQVTQDAKPDDFTGPFEHLKDIVIS